PPAAAAERALPAITVAPDEIECRQAGIVERPVRLSAVERGGDEASGTVRVIEREGPVPTRAHDQHVVIAGDRFADALRGEGQVRRRRREYRRGSLAGKQGLGSVGRGNDECLA